MGNSAYFKDRRLFVVAGRIAAEGGKNLHGRFGVWKGWFN